MELGREWNWSGLWKLGVSLGLVSTWVMSSGLFLPLIWLFDFSNAAEDCIS